jgi:hypothetical protein
MLFGLSDWLDTQDVISPRTPLLPKSDAFIAYSGGAGDLWIDRRLRERASGCDWLNPIRAER